MQATGGLLSLPAAAGDVSVSGLGFTPSSIWIIACVNGSQDARISQGVVVGAGSTKQFSQGYAIEYGATTTNTARFRDTLGINLYHPDRVLRYAANIQIDADGFTVQPSVFDFAVDAIWWAVDNEAGVSVHTGNISTDISDTFSLTTDGASFTPELLGTFYPGIGITSLAQIRAQHGFEVGDGLRQIGVIFNDRDNRSGPNSAAGLWDTDIFAGEWANAVTVQATSTSPDVLDSGILSATGLNTGQYVAKRGGSSASRPFYLFAAAGLSGASVAYGVFQVPAIDSTVSVAGLGFQPRFIRVAAGIDVESIQTTNILPGAEGARYGLALGGYTDTYQHCETSVQAGDASSIVNKASSNNLLDFNASPYTGIGNASTNADGFDVAFTGLDGTQHYVVWMAFGDPGAVETELDADAITLAWSASDAGIVSEEQTLNLDPLTLGWSASDVEVATAGTLSADPVTLGWSATDVALDVFTDIDGVDTMFNWTSSLADIGVDETVLDIDSAIIAWLSQEAGVLPAGVVGPDPVSFAFASGVAGIISEEQALTIENALLSFSSQNAIVLDDANLVSPLNSAFGWTMDEVLIANEQVNPLSCTLGWGASNANIFVELEDRHAHIVEVVRPDSMDVEVYSTNRRTTKGTN